MRRTLTALCLVLAAQAAPAAGPADLLFATPHLEGVAPGAVLRYDHMRHSDPAIGVGPDLDQAIAVTMGESGASSFTLDADGAPRSFDVDSKVPGNPLLMVFLEQALRSVASATGGSPFYLRNRMREALSQGLAEDGDRLVMRPFQNDANRARLGAFADMALSFELSKATPGMIVAMRAQAGPADAPIYAEEIRYEALR